MNRYDHAAEWAGIDPDAPFHDFLMPRRRSDGSDGFDPVPFTAELRETIENYPVTKAIFYATDVVERDRESSLPPEVMEFVGAWTPPKEMTSHYGSSNPWVNPKHKFAYRYSDAVTRCDCGALMLREEIIHDSPAFDNEHNHSDDCWKANRFRAKARLCEKRRERIVRMLHLDCSTSEVAHRIGYQSRKTLSQAAQAHGVATGELRREGRKRAVRTWARLAWRFSPEVIGRVYDCHPQRIRRGLNKYTERSGGDYYGKRIELDNDA